MLLRLLARGHWLALLLVLLAGGPAAATHLLGGEMTYRYLDSNGPTAAPVHYEITVTIYNNALAGAAQPNTDALVGIYDLATGAKITLVSGVNVVANSGAVVSNGSLDINYYTISRTLTPSVPAGCTVQGPSQPFKLQKFTAQVYLPATSLSGFYAVFTRTARNVDITNEVTTGNNQPLTLYTTLAPPLRPNRSPVFSDTAVAIVCQGDTTISLNNAVDADGDRLVYSFGTPYGTFASSGQNLPTQFPPLPNPLTYYGGYSAANPFGPGAGNFALLNASTGVARYGALTQGKYVVAVDVQEYRTINGREVLIGTTRRDLQLIVAACPSTVAPVLPAAITLPRAYTIEAGQSLTIPLSATQSAGHALLMTVNSALLDGTGGLNATFNGNPGTVAAGSLTGTATATGNGTVAGNFVYNSTCGEARANPYDVAVTVKDQACGGKTVADVFRITVTLPSGPTAIAGDLVACDQTALHTYTASGGTAPTVRWRVVGGTIVGSATANPVQVRWTAASGTIIAKGISQYGCLTDSVSQGVQVVPAPSLTVAGNLTICQGSSTSITVSGAGPAYTVAGGPVSGSGSVFTLSPTQTTTYTVTSVQLTANGCASTAQVTVKVNPAPAAEPIVGTTSVCPTVGGIAYAIQNPANPSYQWTVTGGTLASGQGTASITVNWGAAGTGTVSAVSVSALGCPSPATTLAVTINQLLQTVKPSGPGSVCQADGPYTYTTPAVNGSSFAWQLFGSAQGTLTSTGNSTSVQFATAGVAKLVVTQTSNPAGGICRGVSDTLYITVKPSPSTALVIQGPDRFCVNSGAQTYTLGGASGSTYAWQLNGVALASTGSSVSIAASTAVGTYTLTARETNSGGCAGPLYTKSFTVDPRPGAITISGPRFVCPATRTLTYAVANAASTSTFQWAVTGGTVTAGQGTASVTVNFPTTLTANATVSVTETSQYGCAGTAVAATVVPDNAQAPQLTLASVVATDNTKVTLTFSVANAAATPNQVQVLRREAGSTGTYTTVGTVAATATTYVDATANAAQTAYQYSLALTNGCGDLLPGTTPQTTVLVRAVAVPGNPSTPRDQGASNLSWTAYDGFTVANYLVYKQNDAGGYALVATLGANVFSYTSANGGQGFSQCFRVVAVSAAGASAALQSNSNTACAEFTNGLAFYNIITPNNDGQNDKLEILNVSLYPGNTMTIFNRWGRQVYSTTNYNNDSNYWGGNDPSIAAGVYYYLFKLPNGSTTKGWVEVVK
ncbi:gliding motility-associated C-terminal domain-containing protein [Hymenobacter sp. RP-2-7]|uniref:Gliding motility-associated C-terminal domain-containing protein n=1 Tax=Hymenobacter polaris TaxID=2682546 RepID=A0A7Y0ACW3_9BACT|nr:gliding motility-associated C-terminal domain-containing protein [Hymenobacter polaris]NML65033.1 gliding motility-associated C-terminal domain-containing protein [Hymenobacter polaris]